MGIHSEQTTRLWKVDMMLILLPVLLLSLLRPCTAGFPLTQHCDASVDGTIHKYNAKTLNGSNTVNFSDYIGKSVLFVNTATY